MVPSALFSVETETFARFANEAWLSPIIDLAARNCSGVVISPLELNRPTAYGPYRPYQTGA